MKPLPFLFLLCLAVIDVDRPMQAEELARNGSFEISNGPPNRPFPDWEFYGGFDHGNYSIAASAEAHTGHTSCQITCQKKGRAGLASPSLPLAAGSVLEVSCWLKAQAAGAGRVFLNFEGTPGDGWASKDLRTGTYDWTRFVHRAVVPASKDGALQKIVIRLYHAGEGTVWVDDFSIRTLDAKEAAEPSTTRKLPAPLPEPADSKGYRINVVSALEKVFREDDFPPLPVTRVDLAAARNEFESVQLVVEAPWRSVTVPQVQISALQGPGGATIPAHALRWDRVEYVTTTAAPPYFAERGLGSYPDPLLPAASFTVAPQSRQPIWITLKTPKSCPPGEYTGTIVITPNQHAPTTIPVRLTVWDFALTDETHLRTLTWLSAGGLRQWYDLDETPEGLRKQKEALGNYQDMLLEHRLGPGGEAAHEVTAKADGQFDFRAVDATLERLFAKGMNAFIMGTAPNLARQKKTAYSPEFTQQFTTMLRAYSDHLRAKGWLDRAYVYVYDEAPKAAWPEVKRMDRAIRAAAPQVRILQCLNEPEGVRELTGFADVFDVYVAQYHKTGVAQAQQQGAEAWLAVCAYPMDHPNFFLEYPLLDLRATPWLCWKYQARGLEYWSANSWGENGRKAGARWPAAPWSPNAFGRYNGDGYLLYPGPALRPCSSTRLEALRDGLEDYEYLWTLRDRVEQSAQRKLGGATLTDARQLLALDGVVKPSGSYAPTGDAYLAHRRKLAAAIVALQKELAP